MAINHSRKVRFDALEKELSAWGGSNQTSVKFSPNFQPSVSLWTYKQIREYQLKNSIFLAPSLQITLRRPCGYSPEKTLSNHLNEHYWETRNCHFVMTEKKG